MKLAQGLYGTVFNNASSCLPDPPLLKEEKKKKQEQAKQTDSVSE